MQFDETIYRFTFDAGLASLVNIRLVAELRDINYLAARRFMEGCKGEELFSGKPREIDAKVRKLRASALAWHSAPNYRY